MFNHQTSISTLCLCTPESVLGCTLEQHSFALQNGERLFQASDLCGATLDSLLIGFCLGNAPLLDAGIVLVDSVQLLLHTSAIGSGLSGVFVKSLRFFRFVLGVLFFRCLGDRILLGGLVILVGSGLLCSDHLSKALGEIRLAHLKESNDATACPIC